MSEKGEVVSVMPDKIRVQVKDIEDFNDTGEKFSVGSYIRVSDSDDCAIIAMVENFSIEQIGENDRKYILEAVPIGFLDNDKKFLRGGNNIAIPPSGAEPAHSNEIQAIFHQIDVDKRFCFSKLLQDTKIEVPVDGDRFFNKHFAIVGSTGSGKSHTVAKILQEATQMRSGSYKGLNNSHIVIFDIHSEYKNAFPNSNYMDVSNLKLPYWLMNNQINVLRRLITRNKQIKNANVTNISFDTPVKFSIKEVLNAIINLSIETRDAKEPDKIRIKDNPKTYKTDDDKFDEYFSGIFQYDEQKNGSVSKGIYNDGSLEKFISRIRNKIMDKRFDFLFGDKSVNSSLEAILTSLIGYTAKNESNVTIIDLSGVPFEVLSITVSLISRMLFECSYYLKQINGKDCVAPLLLVYEEAHKYVPKMKDAKYNSSRIAIERIAKEGRKYGITLAIVSQRPSEISETIFSQCSNFVVMRLTNPQDQNYVQRLLPDNIGNVTNSLPSLGSGHAIIIGDSIIMPSLVKIEQ